jgi:16S rRNA (cytosine1402-N4)-methyltransferase
MTTPEHSQSSGFEAVHEPVLVAEVISMMAPRSEGVYVDCTVGLGGHTRALLAAGAGRVIGVDRDEAALGMARARLGGQAAGRVTWVHADYRDLEAVLAEVGVTRVDGVVADLGVSSAQLEDPSRGFSFRRAGPLDMRMDQTTGQTLAERLRDVDEATLADVIWTLGEERRSRRVARAILRAREAGTLGDTAELATAVRRGAGRGRWERIDPATRTFQALRIWVNDELGRLDTFLEAAVHTLTAGGRLVVIAFHSLEDRVVKHTFRGLAAEGGTVQVLTRRPVRPGEAEVGRNARARSARLRAVEKLA